MMEAFKTWCTLENVDFLKKLFNHLTALFAIYVNSFQTFLIVRDEIGSEYLAINLSITSMLILNQLAKIVFGYKKVFDEMDSLLTIFCSKSILPLN
jgi:hypothetical protein